ncbi:Fibroblast growth factor receptor 4 [Desmophyllum pertusum]|uniref:Fibroblast growth factor receptor 4 n=1 Tax=Desmophyllum pertusum TaxID=174260 RepID=A0A9X0CHK0_9CNID|nr:Fibroblast growth factor receptor 4 [Desmophyllum pertusum]
MANKRIVRLVWLFMTWLGYRLQATADPDLSRICNEEYGRCVRDAQFQNCTDPTFKPKISTENLQNVSIKVNGTAKFKCLQKKDEAGLDALQFDWIKWGNTLSTHSKLNIDFGNFTVIDPNSKYTREPSTEDGLHVSYLSIHNVTQDDVGCILVLYATSMEEITAVPS